MEGYELFVEFQKWLFFLLIFLLIMFILIKTHGDSDLNTRLLYIFAIICWLIVAGSSILRGILMEDSGSDDGETFINFLPNLIITTIWYIYMANVLVFKMAGKKMKVDTGIAGGAAPGPAVLFTIDAVKDSATILVMMGIVMALLNVGSFLYIYHTCESGLEDKPLVKSLHGAQYNIIIIGLLTVGLWMYVKKQRAG